MRGWKKGDGKLVGKKREKGEEGPKGRVGEFNLGLSQTFSLHLHHVPA